ncbi:unnamed protein product [Rangifer tarandus platyrhynchus]|uniref:Uncharacterized protein n=1 Tax=Rangifer tarandus platyrhynchus TaxID=3082113 RepID=A0ABN8YLM5_RANTA|nr:unnamed protein product [Rangifer tarandus platyrhynchus]
MSRPQSPSRGAGSHPGGKEARKRAATLLPALRGQAAAAGHPKPLQGDRGRGGRRLLAAFPGRRRRGARGRAALPASFSRGSASGRSGQRRA